MRILFIGCVIFSQKSLLGVLENGGNIIGIITKNRSKFNADFVDLGVIARKNDIPCYYFEDINSDEAYYAISEMNPEVIFCFGWSSLIKSRLLNYPKYGIIGYHPTELPKNRGRNPIVWALALGLSQTGSTFFKMNEGADSGDILNQKIVEITENDNANTLYEKLIITSISQIREFMPSILVKSVNFVPQNHGLSNYWRKRNFEDGLIDFRMSAKSIYNTVRALTKPYNGADFFYKGDKYKVFNSKVIEYNITNIEYGRVVEIRSNGIVVKCGENAILLNEIFFENLRVGEYIL